METRRKIRRSRRLGDKPRPPQSLLFQETTETRSKANALDNGAIAELLAAEAEAVEGHLSRAYRRASSNAFLWPLEALSLVEQGKPLSLLPGIGPFLEKKILGWIEQPPPPPKGSELRKNFFTLVQARKVLAKDPSWAKGLKGDLQMHTTWSDGSASVAEMAAAAGERGYEFIAITDHTKGLKIAGGIDEQDLERQGKEIEAFNRKSTAGVTVLKSTEMNLNPRGEGDMDSTALADLDIVLGSFHSALRKTTDQTERYLAALRNPDIQILGHPRGRVYNYRLGLQADWSRVFAEAAHLDKAVEVDSFLDRQDLDVDLLKIARREGVRISLGTDAHHPWQLGFMELGLAAVKAAKIPAERIINFLPLTDLLHWVAGARAGVARSAGGLLPAASRKGQTRGTIKMATR